MLGACGGSEPSCLRGGNIASGKQSDISSNNKHRLTTWSSNSTVIYILKRTESQDRNRHLYAHVHSSIKHNSQKVKVNQTSDDRRMVIENVVYKGTSVWKQKQAHRHRELMGLPRGRRHWGRMAFGMSRCKLLHVERRNNKLLLYSAEKYSQYSVIHQMEENKKKCVYMYNWLTLLYSRN